MKSFRVIFLFAIIFTPSTLSAQDSLQLPSVKVIGFGALDAIRGWEPKAGRLYPKSGEDLNDVEDHSTGFHYGLLVSKRMFNSAFFVTAGAAISSSPFKNFRTTSAKNVGNPYIIMTDVSYSGYKLKAFHLPLFLQIPFVAKKNYFSLEAGVVNDFTYTESFDILYRDYNQGFLSNTKAEPYKNTKTDFTSMRLYLGLEIEFFSAESNFFPRIAISYSSSPVTGDKTDKNFLRYTSLYAASLGWGFGFKKNKQQ